MKKLFGIPDLHPYKITPHAIHAHWMDTHLAHYPQGLIIILFCAHQVVVMLLIYIWNTYNSFHIHIHVLCSVFLDTLKHATMHILSIILYNFRLSEFVRSCEKRKCSMCQWKEFSTYKVRTCAKYIFVERRGLYMSYMLL
jgi:hypothetical protein